MFLVPDTNAPLNHHKHAPFCLAATMRAKIVIPIAGGDGYVRNKTIVIPKSANVSGTCGDQMQRITLEWGNTRESGRLVKSGQLTMLFEVRLSYRV